jgi:hypothetical protein
MLFCGALSACAASKDVSPDDIAMIICHDERRTLTLPEAAAMEHLDHGDEIGACAGK